MKRIRWFVFVIGLFLLNPAVWAAGKPLPKPDVLGEETIYTSQPLSRYRTLVVRDFPMDQAALKNMNNEEKGRFQTIRPQLVQLLSEELVRRLQSKNLFDRVIRNGESGPQTLVLEGRFSKVDAGNRALKFWVGFGAGKSTLTMEGRLSDGATGEVLAVFENDRHAPFNMAEMEKIFDEDTRNLAKDLAAFIEKLY
jgi:hypothetical protein